MVTWKLQASVQLSASGPDWRHCRQAFFLRRGNKLDRLSLASVYNLVLA
jgi:hypothetical protein